MGITHRNKRRKSSPAADASTEEIETSPVLPVEGLTDFGAKRRPWAVNEDDKLRGLVSQHGVKNWALIATELLMRNGKQVRAPQQRRGRLGDHFSAVLTHWAVRLLPCAQCRERWRNHLRPELNKGDWSTEEDVDIWNRVQQLGTKCAACPL